jgi:hypothetical protein
MNMDQYCKLHKLYPTMNLLIATHPDQTGNFNTFYFLTEYEEKTQIRHEGRPIWADKHV